jgi:hypothetical protein
MRQLDDKIIRSALIARLSALSQAPRVILEELRVHNGNAVADVVAVHGHPHCYEIKGDSDSIYRILKQSRFYDLAFKKTTLVTTERQIKRALRIAPSHWGIMIARENAGKVIFGYVRGAKVCPSFDKTVALLTLWKSELTDVAMTFSDEKLTKLNRAALCALIAKKLGTDELVRNISEQLVTRNSRR